MSLSTTMRHIAGTLYNEPYSKALRDAFWVIPTVQSIHIAAIAVVIAAVLVTDLRLAGVLATDESPRTILRRHMPWLWAALAVLLTTGVIMVVAEPNRVFANSIFWTKMALVLVALGMTLLFRYPIMHPEFKLEHARWAKLVKPLAWASMAIWVVVVFCGRWIAYSA